MCASRDSFRGARLCLLLAAIAARGIRPVDQEGIEPRFGDDQGKSKDMNRFASPTIRDLDRASLGTREDDLLAAGSLP